MIVFAAFALLLCLTLAWAPSRCALLGRTRGDWILDATGLLIQGLAIPAAAWALGARALPRAFPNGQGILSLPDWTAFLIAFAAVDYLYYWNHRLLHARGLWPLHAAHHGSTRLDLLSTSRNTVWTSFLIVYVWAHAAALYLFDASATRAYAAGMAVTAALDLYRHSAFLAGPAPTGPLRVPAWRSWAGSIFITAGQHAAHHSRGTLNRNFGANLNLWDKWHGTFAPTPDRADSPGVPSPLPLMRQLFLPFHRKATHDPA